MKKYALLGVGARSDFYRKAIVEDYAESAKLVAICDNNQGRLRFALSKSKSYNIPSYDICDFDKMLKEQTPDTVIVCSPDSTHDDYICRILKAGIDVITEKPMTIDEVKCQRIIDTVKETGKNVRVNFNYRYSPCRSQIKDLLMDGVIGKILSVEFKWMLDTAHGADYFRRWHRRKENSGGLLVHKSTHHFDLVNWWLSDIPEAVNCIGDRLYYNQQQAIRLGLEQHGERCMGCPVKHQCNFYVDPAKHGVWNELYFDCEQYDSYFRDRCIFSDQIDIEDSMNVAVKYKKGTLLSYSLNAFSPWEGYHIAFNGTKGRLEHFCQESSYVSGDGTVPGAFEPEGTWIKVYPHFNTPYEIEPAKGIGGHGGGDTVMLEDIFGNPGVDPLMRYADYTQGAYSIIVGIAANKSMKSGALIKVDELLQGLGDPLYPPMHEGDIRIPFVEDFERKTGEGSVKKYSLSAPE